MSTESLDMLSDVVAGTDVIIAPGVVKQSPNSAAFEPQSLTRLVSISKLLSSCDTDENIIGRTPETLVDPGISWDHGHVDARTQGLYCSFRLDIGPPGSRNRSTT